MSRSVGPVIPESLQGLFEGKGLASRVGLTFLILTSSSDAWPHLAMISVGEVIAVDPRTLRVALWPNSTATGNLERDGHCTLALVHEGMGYYLKCTAGPRQSLRPEGFSPVALFALTVQDVLEDDAPYARLTSGITYELKNPAEVLPRWEATVEALREAGS